MSYYAYIKRRIRHSGFTRLFLEVLERIGIYLRPFVILREILSEQRPPEPDPELADLELRYLGPDDMHTLAGLSKLPGRDIPEDTLQKRLQDGSRCAALLSNGQVAAFTWCDFKRCTFRGYPFAVRENEVYLFDAYTLLDFRGKGLAPYIRYRLYEDLAAQGREVFYSVSDRLNRPSLRFKEKLGARWLLSGVYLVLFSRWRFTFFIKKYESGAPDPESRRGKLA